MIILAQSGHGFAWWMEQSPGLIPVRYRSAPSVCSWNSLIGRLPLHEWPGKFHSPLPDEDSVSYAGIRLNRSSFQILWGNRCSRWRSRRRLLPKPLRISALDRYSDRRNSPRSLNMRQSGNPFISFRFNHCNSLLANRFAPSSLPQSPAAFAIRTVVLLAHAPLPGKCPNRPQPCAVKVDCSAPSSLPQSPAAFAIRTIVLLAHAPLPGKCPRGLPCKHEVPSAACRDFHSIYAIIRRRVVEDAVFVAAFVAVGGEDAGADEGVADVITGF